MKYSRRRRMIKETMHKYREIVSYLIFGVLTTAVSWILYFIIMWAGKSVFDIPANETASGRYIALYTTAQIISWIVAVLFAFFTNRKWVFTDADVNTGVIYQLVVFSSGRLVTLGLDYVITLAGTFLLTAILPSWQSVLIPVIEKSVNLCEIAAKLVAAVAVIIGNYIFSKLFVFVKGKE